MVWDNINDDDYQASSETCGDCGKDLQCYLYGDQIDGSLLCRKCMERRFKDEI